MTTTDLAKSYLQKARVRLKTLKLLMKEKDYSDVVREAQETTELTLKGMLRNVGVEPPFFHDVGNFLLEYKKLFPKKIQKCLPRLAKISSGLRAERELAFYGDVDFIPTEEYTTKEAKQAIRDATFCVKIASMVIR